MVIMKTIFLIMLFSMGAVFGSFFTLAVYRIPLNLDITHKRSFCPNCNHRLEFIDLIPIISYLSLKGKCRYCGKPVRIRYLLLEVLSGIVFLVAYFSFNLNFPFFNVDSVSLMIGFVMFYITNAIILGIDKEYRKIDNRVLLFGIITQTIYILFLYGYKGISLVRYWIYLLIILVLLCINTYFLKKKKTSYYFIEILTFFVYEVSYIDNLFIVLATIILTIFILFIYKLFLKREKSEKKVPIGFCLALSAIISVLIGNIIL